MDSGLQTLELLHAVQVLYARKLDTWLKPHGLTAETWMLLAQLLAEGACSMSRLARNLAAHPSTTTKMVQRLAREGWVQQQPSPQDRRISMVRLTASGHDQVRTINGWLRAPLNPCAVGLTTAQWQRLAPLLQALTEPHRAHR